MTITTRLFAALAVTAAIAAPAHARQAIAAARAWARETAVGQTTGGGYVTITNASGRDDRLTGASSPVAADVQLHTMSMDGGVMRMRPLANGITIPAHGRVDLAPGGMHLMFVGLRRRLHRGEVLPVTLRFQHAGAVKVRFAVQPIGAKGPAAPEHRAMSGMNGMDMGH